MCLEFQCLHFRRSSVEGTGAYILDSGETSHFLPRLLTQQGHAAICLSAFLREQQAPSKTVIQLKHICKSGSLGVQGRDSLGF